MVVVVVVVGAGLVAVRAAGGVELQLADDEPWGVRLVAAAEALVSGVERAARLAGVVLRGGVAGQAGLRVEVQNRS